MKKLSLVAFICCASVLGFGQSAGEGHIHTREIVFPDIPGYITLKTDLHMHTVFSDGNVWPTIRVQEAIRDNLDVVSLTDHIEYLPHRKDIPPVDRNRSYEIAVKEAVGSDVLVVRGAEITHELPPGHCNALFVNDVNPLVLDAPIDQFREARKQDAFVFWNHPSWEGQQPTTLAELTDLHRQLIDEGLLHGIEVVNGHMYSENALQIALDNNLTIMATSDIHELIDWDFDIENGGHRPATLVFAKERSLQGLKDALFARRTVACYKDFLIGREEYLLPLLRSIIQLENVHEVEKTKLLSVTIRNLSSANLILANQSKYGFHQQGDIVLVPHLGSTEIMVQTGGKTQDIELVFQVMSAITAPKTHPVISLHVPTD